MDIYIKYLIISVVLVFLDFIWISFNMVSYSNTILKIQKTELEPRIEHTIIAYIIILFSVIYVAIPFTVLNIKGKDDASIERKLLKSLMYGGAVGFSIYGIYNFTSLAIYKDMDVSVGILDTLWGTTLYTLATFAYLLLPE
jgi:uncharacterized membrane protein